MEAHKRRKSVKEKCLEAYFKLLEEKEYTNITISDVTKTAGVSRTSFYRCFMTFDVLIDYTATTLYEKLVSDIVPRFLLDKERMWRCAIIDIFTKLKNGTAVISKIRPVNFPYIIELIHTKLDSSILDHMSTTEKYDPVCNLAMVFGVAAAWSRNKYKESPEELADFIVQRIMRS